MPRTVLCSTGLSSAERASIERAIAQLDGADVAYEGDLTDRTTHLLAKPGAGPSDKMRVAQRLGLPIVSPAWVIDATAGGGSQTLAPLDIDSEYLLAHSAATPPPLPPATDGDMRARASWPLSATSLSSANSVRELSAGAAGKYTPPLAPQLARSPATPVCTYVPDPFRLLRTARERGELSFEPTVPAKGRAVTLDGCAYALDAPTAFHRKHAGAPIRRDAAGDLPLGGLGTTAQPLGCGGASGRPYTLGQLLFALRCVTLSHSEYFLRCVTHDIEPVLLLDKRALIGAVLPPAAGGGGEGGVGGEGGEGGVAAAVEPLARLLEPPLSHATRRAIECPSRGRGLLAPPPLPSPAASSTPLQANGVRSHAAPTPPADASGGVEASARGVLPAGRDADDERRRLLEQVARLTDALREERSRSNTAANDILLAGIGTV